MLVYRTVGLLLLISSSLGKLVVILYDKLMDFGHKTLSGVVCLRFVDFQPVYISHRVSKCVCVCSMLESGLSKHSV